MTHITAPGGTTKRTKAPAVNLLAHIKDTDLQHILTRYQGDLVFAKQAVITAENNLWRIQAEQERRQQAVMGLEKL